MSLWKILACQALTKALDISSATARVAQNLIKNPAILSDATVKRSAIELADLERYWKSGKSSHFSSWPNSKIKVFASHRKEADRAVVFSYKPFPNILKSKEHRWDLSTITHTHTHTNRCDCDSQLCILFLKPEHPQQGMVLKKKREKWKAYKKAG